MNKKQWLLAIVLVPFTILSLYAGYQMGFIGLFDALTANAGTITLLVDLTIALTMIGVWIWNDARDRGISPLPYLGLMLVAGSVGSLLYLLRIAGRSKAVETPTRLAVGVPAK